MIRVLLVDDHLSFREAMAIVFGLQPDFTVVAQAGSLAEARDVLADVDVAVVDLGLPDGSGLDLIGELRAASPQGAVLVLTASSDRAQFARAVEAGAAGVLHKSTPLHELVGAVRRLTAGEQLLSVPEVLELLRLAGHQRRQDRDAALALRALTPREREVLQLLTEGLNDKEIAQRLHVSPQTARTHMENILNKLGVNSRLQALVFALRHGVVTLD